VLACLRPPALRRSRVRNLLAKLPERERERVRAAYWQALDDATDERDAKQRLQALVDELDKAGYTAASKCLADDLDALVVHLRYPTTHRRRWRSTNLLERSLAEVKRRTKVIGRFPGETSCLTLVWAVLDLYITHAKNGVRFSQLERQRLRRIRDQGSEQTTPQEVSAAQTDHHREPEPRRSYSSSGTRPSTVGRSRWGESGSVAGERGLRGYSGCCVVVSSTAISCRMVSSAWCRLSASSSRAIWSAQGRCTSAICRMAQEPASVRARSLARR
jgi:hypothetical protein